MQRVYGDRVFAGEMDPASTEAIQQRRVLRYVSLFKKFGFGQGSVGEEGQAIARYIALSDTGFTEGRFSEIVTSLRGRRVLQGNRSLYLSPQILHIKLWCEWWEVVNAGGTFNYNQFCEHFSDQPSLIKWFGEMFEFAAESTIATRVVAELLGPNGPFANEEFLATNEGAYFFRHLADADLEAALSYLERTARQLASRTAERFSGSSPTDSLGTSEDGL